MSKIERGLFYFLILTFPLNLGKHFILKQSYANGVLVDYLIPTIYLSDILIFLLFCSSIVTIYQSKPSSRELLRRPRIYIPIFLFLIFLLPSVFTAGNKAAAIYKFLKYLEFSFLSVFIAEKFNKGLVEKSLKFLTAGVIFESILSVLQWLKQGYILGYLPFGESLISPYPPFALVNFLGSTKLRVYGTFPHPNVLGGYLSISLTIMIFYFLFIKFISHRCYYDIYHSIKERALFFLSSALGIISLFLTFSRSSWFVFLSGLLLVVILFRKHIGRKAFWISLVLLLFVLSSLLFSVSKVFVNDTSLSVSRRLELTTASFSMFKDFPLSGVGLNNFTVRLEDYKFIAGVTRFIQPVHNIYLLILSESGLLGLTGFLILISAALRAAYLPRKSRPGKVILVSLLQVMLLGLFDHYLLTLEQGLFIFWILLGMAFSLEGKSLPQEENFPKMNGGDSEI